MSETISRRDFINGVALNIASGLAPLEQLGARTAHAADAAARAIYPPALMGLRGSDAKSFEAAHAVAREGAAYFVDRQPVAESYDLVVVSAGLAGLTAAFAWRQRNPKGKILIIDNHDDFGGHARRCEFVVEGRLIVGYGGSESMVSPRLNCKGELAAVVKALRIDPARFYDEQVFHRTLYPGLGLSRGVFFDRETFGRDQLVVGDPIILDFDEFAPNNPNARTIQAFLADCPLPEEARRGLVTLFDGERDYLADHSKEFKLELLAKTSYRAFLLDICGLPRVAADFFQGRSHDNFGLGIDALPAKEAMVSGLPGAKALKVAKEMVDDDEEGAEPFIHHFPDGNASIARACPGPDSGRGAGSRHGRSRHGPLRLCAPRSF
jgi:spermidine dehydrogenase